MRTRTLKPILNSSRILFISKPLHGATSDARIQRLSPLLTISLTFINLVRITSSTSSSFIVMNLIVSSSFGIRTYSSALTSPSALDLFCQQLRRLLSLCQSEQQRHPHWPTGRSPYPIRQKSSPIRQSASHCFFTTRLVALVTGVELWHSHSHGAGLSDLKVKNPSRIQYRDANLRGRTSASCASGSLSLLETACLRLQA